MSLGTSDLSELLELWAELNLTAAASNLSRVEAAVCSGAVGHGALLHLLSVLYASIFLVGLAANVLVLVLRLRPGRSGGGPQLYAVHLAGADLCAVLTLPLWVASLLQGGLWPFGEAVCKVTHLVFSVGLYASVFFLACVSVERYLSATRLCGAPGGRRRKALRRLTCALLWLLALLASLPDAYFLQAVRSPQRDRAVCRPVYPSEDPRRWTAAVQLSFFVLGFAVPFPVIATSYLLLAAAAPPGLALERSAGRRAVLSYILVFLACWLPFHAVLLLDSLTLLDVLPFSCRLESFLDVALHLTQCFSLLHCCANPVLYTFLHRTYSRRLTKAFVFQYSTRTGLARLMDTSQASETETSAVMVDHSGPV
ncbi:atypical chemokine receptor 3 isoform X2 [Fundulus heteroclitus]|nr:atypical chemokine receptor 3 isoform X2 [Fundulus heteroclitus]XP_021169701.2 atypical chemokine receptor 3 isoform X2 [Fundulus heteroclitus]